MEERLKKILTFRSAKIKTGSYYHGNYKMLSLNFVICVLFCSVAKSDGQMNAFRVETPGMLVETSAGGQISMTVENAVILRLFTASQWFTEGSEIAFTNVQAMSGIICDDLRRTEIFKVYSVEDSSALVSIRFSNSDAMLKGNLMFCLRSGINSTRQFIHQGNSSWLQIKLLFEPHNHDLLPIWAKSILIPIFVVLSGLFSGLALNLLSLTRSELKVMRNQGTSEERRYAKIVMPLRKRGNYLLCTLLCINTLANVAITILFYEVISLYTIIGATLSIVFLGEILPLTICSHFGLGFGAKMVWLTNISLVITFPFSYPVSKLMDLLLKNEIPSVYNRDRFQELLKSPEGSNTGPRREQEAKTLALSTKCVKDIMTKIEDAYMEEYNSILTNEMMSRILKTGYTRVPIYETEKNNIVALLHVKDLALINPGDKMSLKMLCKFYNRPVNFVFEDTKLDVMLEEFKKGQSHMAFVQRVNNEGLGDPFYETLGMVTLEDVIEDIFHSEATLEPNVIVDGKELTSGFKKININNCTIFNQEKRDEEISPALALAAKQFLATLAPFNPQLISDTVLERLIGQGSIVSLKVTDSTFTGSCYIYEKGKPCDYFVMILEGQAQINIGNEHFMFNGGPFACFGIQALTDASNIISAMSPIRSVSEVVSTQQASYVPDFTLQAVVDVRYLRITKSLYVTALQASILQHQHQNPDLEGSEHPWLELPNYTPDHPAEWTNAGFISSSSRAKLLEKSRELSDHFACIDDRTRANC